MSIRNIRKLYGNTTLPPPEGNSDEEYEPLYAKQSPSKYKYQGLVLSSHSESEHESSGVIENTPSEKTTKKKKKKNRKSKPNRSSSKEVLEMDEIDKSVMGVNALLGVPVAPAPSTSTDRTKIDPVAELFAVQHKHLNVANELKKMFGPEALEQGNKRRGRQPNLNRLHMKAIIVPLADNAPNLQKIGLSMSMQRRENDYAYFTFDHSKDYQRIHRTFLRLADYYRTNNVIMPMNDEQRNLHIEEMLEGADFMFRLEEYTAANTLVEQSIAYMQYVAHPSFNLTDRKTRLEYKFVENRPFHVALMKYLHLLTNRACHRTALELAKLLLQLDPSDPLAVLFIVDTLALRAREHQWLIDAVDYWKKERDAGFMFNLQYSYAMAQFHVATKAKGDVKEADKLLQNAILRFPTVVVKILECANLSLGDRIHNHVLFTNAAESTGANLKHLIYLYCKFTWPKWREPAVYDWLTRNVKEVVEKYDKDSAVKDLAAELSNERANLFGGCPNEVIRHLTIIKPMANLLVDGAVPRLLRGWSCDPVPPADTINRYAYKVDGTPATNVVGNSPLYELFTSILPHYDVAIPQLQNNIEQQQRAMALANLEEVQNNADVERGAEAEPEDDTLADDDFLTEQELSRDLRALARDEQVLDPTDSEEDSSNEQDDPAHG